MTESEIPAYIRQLWDFQDPAGSELRFLAAEVAAAEPLVSVLRTQVARSRGLQGKFSEARATLPQTATTPIAQVYVLLEAGRIDRSEALKTKQPVPSSAAESFRAAFQRADAHGFHGLAADALHMLALVAPDPESEIEANRRALDYVLGSQDPEAQRWEGSLRHNLGYALHTAGRLEDALTEFELTLACREKEGSPHQIHIAHWMIAWTLRGLGRWSEALAIQRQLEASADPPDPYVREELAALYRLLGDDAKAADYAT